MRKPARQSIDKSYNILLDRLSDSDAKMAIPTVAHIPQPMLAETLQAMTLRPRERGDPPMVSLAWTQRWKPSELGGLLDALEARTSREAMAPVRLTVIGKWLQQGVTTNSPWQQDDLRLLAGPGGMDPRTSALSAMAKAHADDVLVRQRASPPLTSVEGFTWNHPVMDAASWAAAAHCAPMLRVLAATVDMAPQERGSSRGAGLSLDRVLRQGGDDEVSFHWDAVRCKETIDFMVAHGHNPQDCNGQGRNLIHELAEHACSSPVEKRASETNPGLPRVFENLPLMTAIDEKLMLLVDLGLNAFAKDENGESAIDLLRSLGQPDIAHRFDVVARTYRTRRSAMQALEELERESPSP